MKQLSRLGLATLLFIFGCDNQKKEKEVPASWMLAPFSKEDAANPVLLPGDQLQFNCPVLDRPVRWEEKDVFNPAALVRNDTVFLLYRAEDTVGKYAGTSRIGLAFSTDGFHFTKHPVPIFYPEKDSVFKYEWEGGCEDPRIVENEEGIYFLTYTAYDGDKARLLIASSPDLFHWTKYGPAFLAAGYADHWSKSGAIVCRYENGKAIACTINGKYWMYWGDTDIFLASSDDLVHWSPVEKEPGSLLPIFGPRKNHFDSDLVEPGPPALLTEKGILLIYNSRNSDSEGDPSLPAHTYAAGQILFDPSDPSRVTQRAEAYFLRPDKPYEKTGQVNEVCFVEGLVHFRNRWFLYYGTADSKIAVATR